MSHLEVQLSLERYTNDKKAEVEYTINSLLSANRNTGRIHELDMNLFFKAHNNSDYDQMKSKQ